MTAPGNNEPTKKSNYDGLSDEIKKVIRDEQFQATVGKFVSKNDTPFKIIKGIGFAIAVASGLFGYLLAANSEADDRRAQMIHKIIDEKRAWVIKVNEGILQLRKTRFLIKYDCDHNKAPTLYNQGKMRFQAIHELVRSCSGTREIFGEDVGRTCKEITAFDESVKDVCAKDAPDDEAWRALLRKINEQMHSAIKINQDQLERLGSGAFSKIFTAI